MRINRIRQCFRGQKRHKYLFQLVCTCVTLILFPCILSLTVMATQSYDKLTNTYESYYMESTEKFAKFFVKQLNAICLNSYVIADDSRSSNKAAYQLDETYIAAQSFYMYPATRVIAEYSKSNSALFGIYYYGVDCLLTKQSSFSFLSFAEDYLNIDTVTGQERLKAFFSEESSNLVFYSAKQAGNTGSLYIGVPIKIGFSKSPVMLVYKLEGSSIDTSLLLPNSGQSAQFAILSGSSSLLISFGKEHYKLQDFEAVLEENTLSGQFSTTLKKGGTSYFASFYKDSATDFTYLILLPFDQATMGTQQFYSLLIKIMTVLTILLVGAIALLIYLNYRPISALIKSLNKTGKNVNEFEVISKEINRMTNEISEQNMVIVDSLLGNILYGFPISEEKVQRLGVPKESSCFFVFTLSPFSIDTTQRTEITTALFQQFDTKTYITDILFQKLTVLICMAKTDNSDRIFEFLLCYWKQKNGEDTLLKKGSTVYSLNDIKISFISCSPGIEKSGISSKDIKNPGADFSNPIDPTSLLMQQILEYLEDNYTDPLLSQSAIADCFKISTYSLSRLFKGKSGVGFAEYISNKRIELAKSLLFKRDDPVADIASQVGIPNVNYFYKVFKNNVGMSPTKYRDSVRKKYRPACSSDMD